MSRALFASVLACGLLVVACGDGDESTAPTTTLQTATTTAVAITTTTSTTAVPPATYVVEATRAPATVPVAGDPVALASQIADAETAIRDPATPTDHLPALALLEQAAYRAVAARPEWLPAVLAAVPSTLRQTVEANVTAGMELRALTSPRSSLPPWRIVAPAPAEELLGYYREAEQAYGVPWEYLAAIHLVETRMGRIRGTSTAGAQGPMQFLPSTWAAYGEGGDINSNRDSILAAGRYLRRNGAPHDMDNALFNYNHSQRYVRAINLYAREMRTNERAYLAYYHWQVYYRLVTGDVLLPVGYGT
jgi:membrane-bound lytic murein transglycosylase B